MYNLNDDDKYALSAGLIAFGASSSILLIFEYIFPTAGGDFIFNVFSGFLIYVLSSTFAGFLLTFRSSKGQIVNSLKAGGFGFIINVVIMFFFGTLFGIVWMLFGYILGGIIGGMLGKYYGETHLNKGVIKN